MASLGVGGLGRSRWVSIAAGSSATAIAATVSSDAWSWRRRLPPAPARSRPAGLRSSVTYSCRGFRPRNRNGLSRGSSRSADDEVVRGRLGRGPLLRGEWRETCSSAVLPLGPGESSTAFPRLQSAAVPELPDLTDRRRGFPCGARGPVDRRPHAPPARSPCGARPPSSQALAGQRVERIRRRGKFLVIDLDRDRIVVNPMLTGRFQLAAPGVEATDEDGGRRWGSGRAHGGRRTRRAGRAERPGCRPTTTPVEVRYRDPTQMGKVYLLPGGVDRAGSRAWAPASMGPTPTIRR